MYDELISNYSKVGNIVKESVPFSNNEIDNRVEREWGEVNKDIVIDGKPGSAHHHQILNWIGGFDGERGQKMIGHRGYFLTGYGVILNQALIAYGTSFLMKQKYNPIQPPYFMKREVMAETAELNDFDDQLYK